MSWCDEDGDLGKFPQEDVDWLSSLSDSELDMLISLKKLAIQRAKIVGHENLADKFNVKVLRALGHILSEYLKERVKSASIFSNPVEAFSSSSDFLRATLNHEADFDFDSMANEVLKAGSDINQRKRKMTDDGSSLRPFEEAGGGCKKQKEVEASSSKE